MAARSAAPWWRMCQKLGGCLTLGDLEAVAPRWLDPLSAP